jgi:trans-aconitate 2-methyltransferase
MWDPSIYLRYGDERARPFGDLLARVGSQEPREVVDLGCGPGTLTVGLRERWPHARVLGLDSSEEMIASAAALGTDVEFKVTDVYDWTPGPAVDVVLSNALLQWVPGHTDLLRRWARELRPGAALAFQVPGNFTAASHQAIFAVAAEQPWRDQLADVLREPDSVLDPVRYAQLLIGAGCAVDAWETTYTHLLPVQGNTHPVLTWVEGTALRPVRATLTDAEWDDFRARLTARLTEAYPIHSGLVYFPFRRIFVVARAHANV